MYLSGLFEGATVGVGRLLEGLVDGVVLLYAVKASGARALSSMATAPAGTELLLEVSKDPYRISGGATVGVGRLLEGLVDVVVLFYPIKAEGLRGLSSTIRRLLDLEVAFEASKDPFGIMSIALVGVDGLVGAPGDAVVLFFSQLQSHGSRRTACGSTIHRLLDLEVAFEASKDALRML